MFRVILFVIVSCIVSMHCAPALFARADDGPGEPPVAVAEGGEVAEEEREGEGEGEMDEEPEMPPVPVEPANLLAQKLLDHVVAGRLRLDNRQRGDIERIVQQQAETISRMVVAGGATEEQYQAVYKWYEEKLRDVLTAAQQGVLDANPEGQQARIRMMFAHQSWGNVFQIIADQAGMQLVLDAPPPSGTHNYSSLETYTLTQVLDHLNGVLITRGYNLTRSGDQKKLHLINLNAPVQIWTFPSESPDKLGERASSEFVSVTHNFSRRAPETVATAVKGRIDNPFTHTWLAGQNIIVIDRVENQRLVPDVIRNIRDPDPVPAPRTPDPRPRDPPPPVWKTYTIDNEKIDPEFIIRTFREWAGGIRVLRFQDSRTFHINARTGDHNTLEGIFRRLESDPAVAAVATDAETPAAPTPQATPQGNRTIRLHPMTPPRVAP